MGLDVQYGASTIASATESAISPVTGDTFTVKTGRGPAALVAAGFISANVVYGRITGADIHSGGIYIPGAQAADVRQAWRLMDCPLPEGSIVVPYGYQNSGSNQAVVCGLTYRYAGQYEAISTVAGRRVTSVRVSGTSSSGVPASLGSIVANLSAEKKYAVLGIYGVGSNLRGLFVSAPEFNGLRPGGVIANTGTGDGGIVDFLSLGECPVISGRSPATVGCYSLAAETTDAYVFLAEL